MPTSPSTDNARFNEPVVSYRAYRFPWSGQPATAPAVAVSNRVHGDRQVFVSWNGATDVSSWRVLAGSRPRRLARLTVAPPAGFETTIAVRTGARYLAVQALGASGTVLARSRVLSLAPRPVRDAHATSSPMWRRRYAPEP